MPRTDLKTKTNPAEQAVQADGESVADRLFHCSSKVSRSSRRRLTWSFGASLFGRYLQSMAQDPVVDALFLDYTQMRQELRDLLNSMNTNLQVAILAVTATVGWGLAPQGD